MIDLFFGDLAPAPRLATMEAPPFEAMLLWLPERAEPGGIDPLSLLVFAAPAFAAEAEDSAAWLAAGPAADAGAEANREEAAASAFILDFDEPQLAWAAPSTDRPVAAGNDLAGFLLSRFSAFADEDWRPKLR